MPFAKKPDNLYSIFSTAPAVQPHFSSDQECLTKSGKQAISRKVPYDQCLHNRYFHNPHFHIREISYYSDTASIPVNGNNLHQNKHYESIKMATIIKNKIVIAFFITSSPMYLLINT